MNHRIGKAALLIVGLGGFVALSACHGRRGRFGATRTETQYVKLDNVKSVSVELQMSAGELKVSSGAPDMMDAAFTYDVPAWEPRVNYTSSGDHGEITVDEPGETHTNNFGHSENRWDIRLTPTIPMDIHIEMGAGEPDLRLADLNLTRLHVELGAGHSTVDLAGDWKHDVDVHLEGGVGDATVKLPRGMGVRATVDGGIGSVQASDFNRDGDDYVNDEYGKSPHTVNVRIEGGVGSVRLELSGGPAV